MKPEQRIPSTSNQPTFFDVLVIGSGVAGLFAALSLSANATVSTKGTGGVGARGAVGTKDTSSTTGTGSSGGMRIGIITKGELSQSATRWAQGGIAAVLPGDEDSIDQHLSDTLKAGDGLCDLDAVRILVDEGPDAIIALVAAGMSFDRDAAGKYLRAREGGHSTARVLHAGGVATGAEVERALVEAVRASDVDIMERWFSFDLIIEMGICKGVRCIDPSGNLEEVRAGVVLLATGGAGQLYSVTTNPPEATGDGVAMALRAGVPVADLEFFQFHPTALYHAVTPRPLLSEALRGHGAILRDRDGNRFVDELSPRDKVSRAIALKMAEQGMSHLWLDATGLGGFDERFPTISAMLASCNLDPAVDWLPVAPAAHYVSGGVLTDLDGATGCEGLFAAGEVACTGVHGANRLASNSLLEGLVYGIRAAGAICSGKRKADATGAIGAWLGGSSRIACIGVDEFEKLYDIPSIEHTSFLIPELTDYAADAKMREHFQEEMMQGGGVIRSADGLRGAARMIRDTVTFLRGQGSVEGKASAGEGSAGGQGSAGSRVSVDNAASASDRAPGSDRSHIENQMYIDRNTIELANTCVVADALIRSAYDRRETRGAHARVEYPDAGDIGLVRIVHGNPPV
jgi:L-aspartate oxidase